MEASRVLMLAFVLGVGAVSVGPALVGPSAEASGPGYGCDIVYPLQPVQTEMLTPGLPFYVYGDSVALPGTTYAVTSVGAPVDIAVYTERYQGWGWKCFLEACAVQTIENISTCTIEEVPDLDEPEVWVFVTLRDWSTSAQFVLTATNAEVPDALA